MTVEWVKLKTDGQLRVMITEAFGFKIGTNLRYDLVQLSHFGDKETKMTHRGEIPCPRLGSSKAGI